MHPALKIGVYGPLMALLFPADAQASSWPEAQSGDFTLNTSIERIDTDGDGMLDDWEIANGTNFEVPDADANPDGDSRTNLEEYNAGTDPLVAEADTFSSAISNIFALSIVELSADSDGDGLPDWWEDLYGLSNTENSAEQDPDNDGLNNLQEFNGGWNPLVAEDFSSTSGASGNFLADLGASQWGESTDTDSDGMPDWWEDRYGLDRLVDDADLNPDGDNRTNLEEYLAGYRPDVDDLWGEVWLPSGLFALNTGGSTIDTDGDGMSDTWELIYGLNPEVNDAALDPDGDGWSNLEEYNAGTNPLVDEWAGPTVIESQNFLTDTGGYGGGYSTDTDGDGLPDWWEEQYGLDPTSPDADGNPDGDTLTNLGEYNAGSDPTVFDYLYVVDAEGNLFLLDTGGKFSDLDADGIPNWWERKYTGDYLGMLPWDDLDGDGRTNIDEYESGMNPNDPGSYFKLKRNEITRTVDGDFLTITWDTLPDRIYRVYATEHMRQWPSTPALEISGDGNTAVVDVPIEDRKRYFLRVEVQVIQPPE